MNNSKVFCNVVTFIQRHFRSFSPRYFHSMTLSFNNTFIQRHFYFDRFSFQTVLRHYRPFTDIADRLGEWQFTLLGAEVYSIPHQSIDNNFFINSVPDGQFLFNPSLVIVFFKSTVITSYRTRSLLRASAPSEFYRHSPTTAPSSHQHL
jgi:hypothetical protein